MSLYLPPNNSSSSPMSAPVIPPYSAPSKQSGYPMFQDGDVLIVSPTGKQWKLHSLILAQASSVLNKILASSEPATLSKKERDAGKNIFFKLEMVDDYQKFKDADPQGLRYKAFRSVVRLKSGLIIQSRTLSKVLFTQRTSHVLHIPSIYHDSDGYISTRHRRHLH